MTIVQQLARFVNGTSFAEMSEAAREQIRIRILDSLGTAIGAVSGPPIKMIRAHIKDFSHKGPCTLVGGETTAPDFAALYNSALVRYLDYNDSYLAKGETCHPSDNLGSVLAAGEYANISGKELMTALATAYQVQCRLSDEAPVRAKGFDHTTQGAYAVAAGVAKALTLSEEKIAHAMAISGTALNALRVTRTGALSHWKGLAYPWTGFGATSATFLAMRGTTGPPEVFEGNKGFQDSIVGEFQIDWQQEDLERVTRTIVKKFNAEIHSQATLEGAVELKQQHDFDPNEIDKIEIITFDVAFHIIGGGEEGNKTEVRTKEEADHSLHYMTAVALLDGQVLPEQYVPDRIARDDVQNLLRKITVQPSEEYSNNFPNKMQCDLVLHLKNGQKLDIHKEDYEGFHTRPMSWQTVSEKFEALTEPYTSEKLRRDIIELVQDLETHSVKDLTKLLAQVDVPDD
ncbi:MmgE/PrpD family protein [candidate division KSB1 bacterium]|nr:MmgE/PrpD family protein [candidate division KSB1 bacterium]NIR70752.1 MmgE/PrpD family protein [candidate division KSB1 bacterium]NIS23205.1 MmgE/PrpD family protein [candidate division KSB1 bacterium]NIT70065.1 MmgE/PrpD family protein [candidate division KSB1 bacterium]NIU23702.1 MmgE/PrpD family protein [candidate division KSB1 bacterium]